MREMFAGITFGVTLLACTMAATVPSRAADAANVTHIGGCAEDCQKEVDLLRNLRDSISNEMIRNALGQPDEIVEGSNYRLERFEAARFEFSLFYPLAASADAGEPLALHLFAKTDGLDVLPIPFLEEGGTGSENTNLGDLDARDIIGQCPGEFSGVDARYLITWSADCDFGGDGQGELFSFQTSLAALKCTQHLGPFEDVEGLCPETFPIQQVVILLRSDLSNEMLSAQQVGEYISEYANWGEVDF